jgi:uncharacterized membrane protein
MIVVSIFLVLAQILLKLALVNAADQEVSASSFFGQIMAVLTRIHFWEAMLSLMVGGFIWIYVLRQGELSLVYPLVSISYVISLFASSQLLGERITPNKLFGTLIIVLGIVVLMWGGRSNGE